MRVIYQKSWMWPELPHRLLLPALPSFFFLLSWRIHPHGFNMAESVEQSNLPSNKRPHSAMEGNEADGVFGLSPGVYSRNLLR